jgi:sulfonate transport system substrate-binding protein
MRSMVRIGLAITAFAALLSSVSGARAADPVKELKLDYAYYNPVSLVLKKQGWLEQELTAKGVQVTWVLSLGSNKALEYLSGSSVDFGSTAGAAALIGRANGNPIKAIYVYSHPEWTALVTTKDSSIHGLKDLKGRKVAVTRGTDPFIFLLRGLASVGLTDKDVTLVPLQHGDGRLALDRGDVDAWSGLDPYMAQAEIESGDRLFFRDPNLNSFGVLNVREEFATAHPELVDTVLRAYERARLYAIGHREELAATLAEAAKLTPEVAARQLERTDLSDSTIGARQLEAATAAGDVLKASGIIAATVDVPAVAHDLIDARFSEKLARK